MKDMNESNLEYVLLINNLGEKYYIYDSFLYTRGWYKADLPLYWNNLYRMTVNNLLIFYKDKS